MKAGVIGLGTMGAGMAANLAANGMLAAVWNRTQSRAQAFVDEHPDAGVLCADSPTTVAVASDVIITCVSADADVLEMVDALLPSLAPGKVVVDTSTIAADTAREAAERVRGAGAAFLDAPVSGGVEGAKNATMVMMVGGDEAVLERIRPVLSVISRSATWMGPVGAGQATKAVNQIMAAGINQVVTEALAFGKREGLDLDRVIEVVSGGAAGNWFVEHRGPTLARGTFEPGFKVALHHKDLGIVQDMLQRQGAGIGFVDQTRADYERLMEQGHGDEDISALYRLKRPSDAD